jgi:sigma-B regulation protein RsbU (phosphoserine phosphatase)
MMSTGDGDLVDGFIEALLDDDAQMLYERAPCGYLSTTSDGTLIKVNGTFLTLTGYTREELIGRLRFDHMLAPGGRIYHETHFAPMLRMHGSAREIAFELLRADGSRLPVLVNAVLERDNNGNPLVIRIAVFDATQRRRYEAELLREKERAEASEMRATALARTLQQTLIPPVVPHVDGLDVGAEYRPAGDGSEVGGDFYDIFQTGDDDWVVVIGDVCGKGVNAAVVTALARYTLRAAAVADRSPARALSLLNDAMYRADVDRFCTAAVLRLTRRDGHWWMTSCSAGHPLPLHIDPGRGVAPIGEAGTLLGALDQVELVESSILLVPGSTLVTYTDGVSEARSASGEFFDDARIFDHLRAASGSAGEVADSLLAGALDFQDGVARDDIAIVVVRVPTDQG